MSKHRIRRTSSNYVGAVNKQNYINIDMPSTYKNMIYDRNITNMNLNELFMRERSQCKNYRVILTIQPYCSNVLFNSCTEFTRNEGSDNVEVVTNDKTINFKNGEVYGKQSNVNAYDMVRNSEYSRESVGFEYHPGLDYFNNHILRNKSYRIVNLYNKNTKQSEKNKFNTIEDLFRLHTGEVLKKCCRVDINDTSAQPKHLYNAEDILIFENGDAINDNLKEDNGWFGFYNTSTIDAKGNDNETLDISKAVNDKGNCQFVDMYPDRTLFSFEPKYNKHRSRCEYNWDVVLTYPFASTTKDENNDDIFVLQDGDCNALLIADAEYCNIANALKGVRFRTYTKHNLSTNDFVHLYFNENENGGWVSIGQKLRVVNTGDGDGRNQDYYFSVNAHDILEKVFCTPKKNETFTKWDYIRDYFYTELTNVENKIEQFIANKDYAINEVVKNGNDIYVCVSERGESRLFDLDKHFVPMSEYANVYSEDGLTTIPSGSEIIINVDGVYFTLFNHDTQKSFIECAHTTTSDDFIMTMINNAFRNNDDMFNESTTDSMELYDDTKSSLWSDYISFRFAKVYGNTDSKYYVRKFKLIQGVDNKEFYRLAFANTIYGDGVSQITYTDTINIEGLKDNLGRDISEMYATILKTNKGYKKWYGISENVDYNSDEIEYSHCFGPITSGFNFFSTINDKKEIRDKRRDLYDVRMVCNNILGTDRTTRYDINLNKYNIDLDTYDWFYGDIVEFNPELFEETVLCDVNFRFNTVQREYFGNNDTYKFLYDEIMSDDYDGEFKIQTNEIQDFTKHEGYYYQPHYKLRLRGIGDLVQSSHQSIFVQKAEPYQDNGMFIKVKTKLKHNLVQGNKVVLTDTVNNIDWFLDIVYIHDSYSFSFNKVDKSDPNYIDWVTICTYLNNGTFKLKSLNKDIPEYAAKTGISTYMWRETIDLWEDNDSVEYPFANNAFYIDTNINFYLKRQNGDRSLNDYLVELKNEITSDVIGLKNDEAATYDYKEESEMKC